HGASDPGAIDRLIHIVEDELGLPLHQSIEASKRALSERTEARFTFEHPGITLEQPLSRAGFEGWIAEEIAAIDTAVSEALQRAGIGADAVDRVFTTGGSSLVPAVREALAARFGAGKLVGGEELTSVAWGLAATAAQMQP
ncbi:MAG TPA: Hsp70 family protein, partial [Polyangia bacterium]